MIMIIGLAGCGSDGGSDGDGGEAASFGTIQELGAAVCDPGTFEDTGDDFDFSCEIDGNSALLTDWSTLGGAPEEGPGKLTVDDVFGIQAPPAAIETARERVESPVAESLAAPSADEGAGDSDGEGDPVLSPGDTATLGPNDEGQVAEVTLNSVSYPKPKGGDTLSRGRVLVALEMRIEHVEGDDIYGVPTYPNYQTMEGQLISDTGQLVAPMGNYASDPEYREELPDTVGAGQFVQGWAGYEVPPEAGMLEFPYGPSTYYVMVEPPT